jgi:hypothetical protein
MKKPIYFISVILALSGCANVTISSDDEDRELTNDTIKKTEKNHSANTVHAGNLFTVSDAEKILGEPGHLTDSSSKMKGVVPGFIDSMSALKKEALIYSCGYMANSMDMKTGKTGIIYFVCEQYPEASSAQKVYSFYQKANKNAIGFKTLDDIGDEAWFGNSPLFVQARKDNKIFVLKVNKMTSKTSPEEFNLVARKIANAL